MILSDKSLNELLPHLIRHPKYELVNPASVDIRIGSQLLQELAPRVGADGKFIDAGWTTVDLQHHNEKRPYILKPGDFVLVSTYEWITVPNGYAVELRLKSSSARAGFDHSLAFWIDPGWDGILTMEIRNITKWHQLPLWYGMKFAQLIVHMLDTPSDRPYTGKYQNADGVETVKMSE